MPALEDFPQIVFESAGAFGDWLAAHHGTHGSIWAVTYKKTSKGPYVPYGAMRDEAMCWGWVDRLRRRVDDEKTALLFGPRKAGGNWTEGNKQIAERLIAEGRMQPAGLKAYSGDS